MTLKNIFNSQEVNMLHIKIFLMFLLITILSVANAQMVTKTDSRVMLIELGNMLTKIPETKKDCQVLLGQIKSWQKNKLDSLNELEKLKEMLRITAPSNSAQVPWRPAVEGTVADQSAKVWVIVHPMEISDYWVQPSVTIKEDGTWKITIYIGNPGTNDVGKQFEIMAIANPKTSLNEGDKLGGWPEAQWKSQVVEVTRSK
jgi:hypothetical protein